MIAPIAHAGIYGIYRRGVLSITIARAALLSPRQTSLYTRIYEESRALTDNFTLGLPLMYTVALFTQTPALNHWEKCLGRKRYSHITYHLAKSAIQLRIQNEIMDIATGTYPQLIYRQKKIFILTK